jgi:hypothetical protein
MEKGQMNQLACTVAAACVIAVAAPAWGADTTATVVTDTTDAWLDSVWTQVDDMVKELEHKLQETVTTSGVRGAELEDNLLGSLGYVGVVRPPNDEELTRAIDLLRAKLTKEPDGADAPALKYYIAQCLERRDQATEAREGYQRVVREHPKTPWSKKAAGDLKRLVPMTDMR